MKETKEEGRKDEGCGGAEEGQERMAEGGWREKERKLE